MSFNDDEPIVLPPGTRPTVPGIVQLVITRNNDKAPLEENIQKVLLELSMEENNEFVGGNHSFVVWDLMVTVTPIKDESTVKWVSARRYHQSIDNASGSVTITIGTLYSKEVHKVLVDILLPVTKKEDETDVLKVSYRYRYLETLYEANSATVTVRRMSELTAEQQQPRLEVTMVEVRLLIAELIKHATGVANKEDLKSVRDRFVHSLKTLGDEDIRDLKSDLTNELKQLRAELDKLSVLMESQETIKMPHHSLAYSIMISHFAERGSARGNNKFQVFATPAMQEFLEEAKMYDGINDLRLYMDRFIYAIDNIEMIIDKV